VTDGLLAKLQIIHTHVCDHLRLANRNLENDQIRANIFLGDCSDVDQGVPCMLRMPERLWVKMHTPLERSIAFRPGQGATGQTFNGQGLGIYRPPWPVDQQLSAALVTCISADIKWIRSWPLKDAKGEVIGVLNIDGLEDFQNADLEVMSTSVDHDIRALEQELAKLERVTVTIRIERI
jgi:hypothetical protein